MRSQVSHTEMESGEYQLETTGKVGRPHQGFVLEKCGQTKIICDNIAGILVNFIIDLCFVAFGVTVCDMMSMY